MANRYRHITGSKSISGDFDNINETFDMIEDDVVALEKNHQSTTQSVNSLQTQINELVVNGDSSPAAAQAAIDAKGYDYKNLKRRLDEEHTQLSAQLADKAQQTEITRIDTAMAKLPTKAEVRESTLVRPINVSEMDTETRQLFTGGAVAVVGKDTVLEETIVDKQVTPRKTTFFKNNPKNLFEGQYLEGWILNQDPNTGREWFDQRPDLPGGICIIVQVQPNTTYYIKKNQVSDRFRIGSFENYPTAGMDSLRQDRDNNAAVEKTFRTSENENYLVIQLSNSSQKPIVAISDEGYISPFVLILDEYTPNNSFAGKKLKNNTVTEDKTTFFQPNPDNIFDGVYDKGYILAKNLDGVLYEYRKDDSQPDGVSIIVPIEGGNTYYIKKFDQSNRFRIATFDHKPINGSVPIRGYETSDTSFEFISEINETYIAVQLSISGETPRVVVNTTGFTERYISDKMIPSYYLPDFGGGGNEGGDRKFILSGNFNEYYRTEELSDMSIGSEFVLQTSTISDIYSLYEDLVISYPDFIIKNHLGDGYNLSGEIDPNFPIYEYVIEAPQTRQETHTGGHNTLLKPAPLILITSGVHGNEKAAVWGVYQFVRQLLENPTDSEVMDDLKSNVSFRVIPIVNPGGYNANTRNNPRNVNINRNFSYLWEQSNDGGKGSAPYSEVETQIVRDWLDRNKQAFAYLDYHNFTRIDFPGRHVESVSYHFTPNEKLDLMYSSLMRRLSNKWRQKYFSVFSDLGNVAFGFVHSGYYGNTPSTINEAYYVHGINLASTPESTYNDPVNPSIWNTKTVVETNTEMLINYVLATTNNFS